MPARGRAQNYEHSETVSQNVMEYNVHAHAHAADRPHSSSHALHIHSHVKRGSDGHSDVVIDNRGMQTCSDVEDHTCAVISRRLVEYKTDNVPDRSKLNAQPI